MIKTLELPDISFYIRKGGAWRRQHISDFFPPHKHVLLVTLKGAWMNDREVQFYERERLGFEGTVVATVNDSFVQNAWANDLNLNYVRLLPDGNGELARALNLLVSYPEAGPRAYRSEWEVYNNHLMYRQKSSCP